MLMYFTIRSRHFFSYDRSLDNCCWRIFSCLTFTDLSMPPSELMITTSFIVPCRGARETDIVITSKAFTFFYSQLQHHHHASRLLVQGCQHVCVYFRSFFLFSIRSLFETSAIICRKHLNYIAYVFFCCTVS